MGALAWLMARELRARWRGVAAIALLVGLVGGVVLATAAGARRTGSAYERFVERTATRDASVQVDDGDVDEILAEIEQLDLVAASGRLEIIPVQPTDGSLHTEVDLAIYASPDGRWSTDLDRPLVLEGRMPAPGAAGEVLVNELAVEQTGLSVGDTIEVATFTPDQLEALHSGGTFDGFGGPTVDLQVVGIGRQGTDLQGAEVSQGVVLLASAATHQALDGRVGALTGLLGVRLAPGATVGELRTEARRIVGDGSFEVGSAEEDFGRSTQDATGVLARALAAFAAVGAVAGAVAVGGAVTRQCAASQDAMRALGAVGCDRRQRAFAGAAVPLVGGALGTVLAVAGAVVASGRFPVSVARRVEPDPGVQVDALVLAVGSVVLLAAAALWSLSSVGRLARAGRKPLARRPWSSLPLRPSASIGIGHAFDRRTTGRTVPVRAALAASVLGVLGVVGTATVVRSFDALVDDPTRQGWTWSAEPDLYTDDPEALVEELAADPGVEAIARRRTGRLEVEGSIVPGFAFDEHTGDLAPPLREGRLPAGDDEVALGARTAAALGVGLGERVTMTDADGGSVPDVEVVGVAVFAPVETKDPGTGALVTSEGLERYRRSDGFSSLLVRYREGFDPSRLEGSIMERGLADFAAIYARPRLPGDLENLDLVMPIVVALGAFFAALGLAGLTHGLMVGARRRRHELATLRALGMRRGQVRSVVVVTGFATALFGALLGAPLGVAAGRSVWTLVIGGKGMLDAPTVPALVVVGVIPAALLVALAVSWWPGTAATRRPGQVLRSE